ncbi:hypothetical protein [Deinococcus misasensis]|uniref:hypothetical protein n=1 Tax=Deinococcus misasensis TaxID=392413 RepID=UPI000A76C9CB|nr:hypothetical protein [Deinococcus misasensis]
MEPVAKKLAASLTVWNIAIAAAEALAPLQGMKVKFPRTNFVDPKTGKDKVGGSYRPRKGYDEKSKTFWFWMAVI